MMQQVEKKELPNISQKHLIAGHWSSISTALHLPLFSAPKFLMENRPIRRGKEIPSPNSSSNSSSSSSSGASASASASAQPKAAPLVQNSYPTTFIQADTSSFKHVVQMLTGSAETAMAASSKCSIPPSGKPTGPKKAAFKLYERRGSMKHLKMISPGRSHPNSPRKTPEILSPSMLDLPSLALSPVTPLISDPFDRSIAEKEFCFHPSPRTDAPPPRLLPLFPLSSSSEVSSASST